MSLAGTDPGPSGRFTAGTTLGGRYRIVVNVCRVHGIGEVDGRHYISMEYVDGEDLASLLRRIGRFPQERALVILPGLAAWGLWASTAGRPLFVDQILRE